MYKHHEESIQNLVAYFSNNQAVLAIVLGGSIAKGLEKFDSDIDAEVIVTDSYYNELVKEKRVSEGITGHCTYENGYFDVKYFTKNFLNVLAIRGSEPSRNAFVKSYCIFSRDKEIENIIPKIGIFQESEKKEKMDSFYSALALNYHYFWHKSKDNLYLRVRCTSDIVLFGYRLLLQDNGVLFPCQRDLSDTVSKLQRSPVNIVLKGETLLKNMRDEDVTDFVESILNYIDYQPPKDWSEVLTRYTDDNEIWWYKERPVIAEW